MPVIQIEKIESICTRIFEGAGLSTEEAQRIAHSLVLSNLMGHDSHGVIRVTQYIEALKEGLVQADRSIKKIRESDASAVVDGGWGFGQTVCRQAMELAMEKARTRSVAAVSLYNSSHIGRLGEYVEMAAEANMIGITMCNNHGMGRLMCAFGGIDPKMSPNPIAIGFPTGNQFPIVVDMTASVVAEGKIRVQKNRGEKIPEGWALNAQGNATTDPNEFYGPPLGALLPFGGIAAHKGYALSVAVDILSGALGGAGCSREDGEINGNGVFLMAIDIQAFKGADDFKMEVDTFIQFLKNSRLMPGFDEINMPGEIEYKRRQRLEKEGIEIDEKTWQQIFEAAKSVSVSLEDENP
jgi:hydroxycarboxylate dehydrogenase B